MKTIEMLAATRLPRFQRVAGRRVELQFGTTWRGRCLGIGIRTRAREYPHIGRAFVGEVDHPLFVVWIDLLQMGDRRFSRTLRTDRLNIQFGLHPTGYLWPASSPSQVWIHAIARRGPLASMASAFTCVFPKAT